jgi:non-ribosomal peptide synthase protein (TIGR01720 family)
LLEDLSTAYDAARRGTPITLPPEAESYRLWTQRLASSVGDFQGELEHWRAVVSNISAPARLPRCGTAGERTIELAELDEETTNFLFGEAHAVYRTRGQELLLAALVDAWSRWSGFDNLTLDIESHGRGGMPAGDVDLSRTVGWLTALFPVRLTAVSVDGTTSWAATVSAVKEALRELTNGGLGFGVLRYLAPGNALSDTSRPLSFNYLGRFDVPESVAPSPGMKLSAREVLYAQDSSQALTHPISVTVSSNSGRLQVSLAFADPAAGPAILELLDHYMTALDSLVTHCRTADISAYQPSDFSHVGLNTEEMTALLEDLTEGEE